MKLIQPLGAFFHYPRSKLTVGPPADAAMRLFTDTQPRELYIVDRGQKFVTIVTVL